MRKDRQAGTVRGRLLLLTLALLAAFSLLLAVYGSVMVGDLRERMLLEAEEPLQSYMQEFHNRKESMEQYLSYLAVTNDAFQSLSAQSSREALYLASDALQNELAAMAGMSGGEYLIVLYHRGLDFMLAARQSVNLKNELALLEERSFRQALQVELRQGDYPADRWFCVQGGDEVLYVRVAQYKQILCCVACPLSRLLAAAPAGADAATVLYYKGQPLFNAQVPFELPDTPGQAAFQDGYLVAQASENELTLVRFTSQPAGSTGALPLLLIALAVAVLLIFVLGVVYLWNGFYRPVARLAATMERLQNSSLTPDALDHVYSGAEFRQMNAALKNLLSQITEWKVKVYEKELERRDAQLQYLRSQIRPHFYLNCLKNLYAMAQVSTPEKMQESIRYLSVHMRYIFSDHAQLTTLGKELELCQNYVALFSSMNATYPIQCSVEVEPELREKTIPPVTLLSLVENCVKYSIRQDRPLKILLTACLLEGEEGAPLLNTSVRDNGSGFSPEWLDRFNHLESGAGGEDHVGMTNLVRRCRELYGEAFHIAFYNGMEDDKYCGACVDLFIPAEKGESLQDETADRG